MTTLEFTKYIRAGTRDTSIPNNSLTEFTYHFNEPISLGTDYEVSITESVIPFNFYNVSKDTELQLEVYASAQSLLDHTDSDGVLAHRYYYKMATVETGDYDVTIGGYQRAAIPFKLHFAIRFRILKGFYQSIQDLLRVAQQRVHYLLENKNKFKVPTPRVDQLSEEKEPLKKKFNVLAP